MTSTRIWAAWALAGLLLAGCQSSPPAGETPGKTMATSSGGGDLKAMREAMNKATGWHVSSKSAGVEAEVDIVCPDKVRTVSKTGNMTVETIMIGNNIHTKVGKTWVKTTAPADSPLCGAGSSYAAPTASSFAKVTKGGTATVNGESCQEWTIATEGSSLPPTTMCIGSDSLPRQTKTGETTITYSNWNKPATIEAPK